MPEEAPTPNRLQRALAPVERLPAWVRGTARSLALGRVVPFVQTAGLRAEEVSVARAVFSIPNRRRVQNHIQGVHAAAMALLAETATGMAFGMHVRDDALPLLKSMQIRYQKVATGSIRAEARILPEDRARIAQEPRGDVVVQVTLTDEAGVEPAVCEFVWAWVPRKRS